MKYFFRIICGLFFCFFIAPSAACSTLSYEEDVSFRCPFTELNWESSLEDIITIEGKDYSTYDSVYGGLCYTFPKEYMDLNGTIKYMFDENLNLVCVAWAYTSEDAQELYSLYDTINASVNQIFGESEYNPQNSTNYGNVWYREDGNIILSIMNADFNKALQYAYLHPSVSSQKVEDKIS